MKGSELIKQLIFYEAYLSTVLRASFLASLT